jgi:hypothetical protein
MAIKKKQTQPDHLLYLWQHQKTDSYSIPFIVNVINDCHKNSRAMKRRQQNIYIYIYIYCESAYGHMAL